MELTMMRGVDNIAEEILGSGDDILIIRWASVRGDSTNQLKASRRA
jgi:hypothetical protein